MPRCRRRWVGSFSRLSPSKRISPVVAGKRPAMTFTVVLLPEPFGPISPTISSLRTVRSRPSTALTPPKWRERARSSSTVSTEEPVGPQVHGRDDQRAEEQVAPVAEETQAFHQHRLHEDHRGEGTEDVLETAD